MHKYIFLIATFVLFSCKEIPRSANSLCSGPKPVKCYAPDPNPMQTGGIPRPQECCVQNKYILPGENAPLPRRGVEFTPNPNPQPGVPQQNFNYKPGASLNTNNNVSGISTGSAPENNIDDSVFIKKPEIKAYTTKATEISHDAYSNVPTGSFNMDLQRSDANAPKKPLIPYEQNLNAATTNKQWQDPNNIVIKKQQANFGSQLPSVKEQYSLDAFKNLKQSQAAENSNSKSPFTYERYNFAESDSHQNTSHENKPQENSSSNLNSEFSVEKDSMKKQELLLNPASNLDNSQPSEKQIDQNTAPTLPKLELKINNQEAIKAKEIDDETYQKNDVKSDTKVKFIETGPELPKLPKLPDF